MSHEGCVLMANPCLGKTCHACAQPAIGFRTEAVLDELYPDPLPDQPWHAWAVWQAGETSYFCSEHPLPAVKVWDDDLCTAHFDKYGLTWMPRGTVEEPFTSVVTPVEEVPPRD